MHATFAKKLNQESCSEWRENGNRNEEMHTVVNIALGAYYVFSGLTVYII